MNPQVGSMEGEGANGGGTDNNTEQSENSQRVMQVTSLSQKLDNPMLLMFRTPSIN